MDFLGGIGSIVGSIYAADQSKKSAREQMAFQERMSSSSHQREVEDLRAAGLNPILSAGGSGADGAPGAGYEVDPDIGSKAVTSATEVQAMRNANKLTEADVGLKAAQEEQAHSAAALQNAQRKILGPKSYLLDKMEEALRSTSKTLEEQKKKGADFIKRNTEGSDELQKRFRENLKEGHQRYQQLRLK